MNDDDRLARDIDAVTQSTPGVTRTFSADPVARRAARRLMAGGAEHLPLSTIAKTATGIRVVVSIGVDGSGAVAETGARVAAAIHALVGEEAEVTVRVSRVVAAG